MKHEADHDEATPASRPGVSKAARLRAGLSAIDRRPSLFTNTLTNMIWYVFVLIQGFVLPRLISDHLGRDLLGVWDLGWTLVFYTNLLALGTRGAVSRYVARHRVTGDWPSMNEMVNSSLVLLFMGCAIGLAAAGAFCYFVPYFMTDASPDTIRDARWVVLLLSTSAALQLPGGVFNAVITGCERFDLLNIMRGVRDIGVLVVSAALLYMGYGLVTIAALVLAAEFAGDVSKLLLAHRLCPSLSISPRHFRWSAAREMLAFGGKTVVRNLSRGGTYQFNSLMVSAYLGPAALAVFARQRAPVSHAMKFMTQYAQVFIPKSSALDAGGDNAALQRLLILTTKYGFYLTLPIIALLLVMGTPLMTVWMGPDYIAPAALAIFTISHALLVPQQGAYSILMGINRHGRISYYELASLLLSLALGVILMGPMEMGITGAAIAVSVPLALSNGIWMPYYTCRMLNLSFIRYVRESMPGPLMASIPCFAALYVARWSIPDSPGRSLLLGLALMTMVMLPIYWFGVMPAALRGRIFGRVESLLGRTSGSPETGGSNGRGRPHHDDESDVAADRDGGVVEPLAVAKTGEA